MLKKYTWVFPFIGGITSIIGILTPVATYYNYFILWMWGLVVYHTTPTYAQFVSMRYNIPLYDFSVEYINEILILNIGIIASIIIVLFSVLLIVTGFLYKRGYFDNRRISKLWISSGIIIVIVTIIPLVTLDFYTFEGNFPSGIWVICDPGFGAIGPILGGVVSIGIGIMVSISKAGRRQKPIPISAVAPKNLCPHCGKLVSLNATFCSKCGKTIENNIF